MSARDDGGPAFPVTHPGGVDGIPAESTTHLGMTLRDYFAGQALPAAIIAAMRPSASEIPWRKVSEISYSIADAMLAARKEPTP